MVDVDVVGLADVATVADAEIFGTVDMTVVLDRSDSQSVGETVRSLYLLFQTLDSVRLVCDAVLADANVEGFVIDPPSVVALSKSNPVSLTFSAPKPLAIVWAALVRACKKARTAEATSDDLHASADLKRAKAEVYLEQARALRLTNDLRENAVRHISSAGIRSATEREIRIALPPAARPALDQTAATSRADAVIADEVLPSVTELFAFDFKSIEITGDQMDETDIDNMADEMLGEDERDAG